jgi:2-methylcitrate dehydratase PrpD
MAGEIHHPVNGTQAQFNIPFAVAVALHEGNASIFQFSDEQLGNPAVCGLMNRIEVHVDKSLDATLPDKRGAAAEVFLKGGRALKLAIDNAKGEPEYPIDKDDLIGKFYSLARPVLGGNAEAVCEIVMGLDSLDDVATLTASLKPL